MAGVTNGKPEQRTFIVGDIKYNDQSGCCSSPHTKRCCLATGVLGGVILLLGLVLMVAGKGLLEGAILKSMALKEGSGRLETWLSPEKAGIKAHLTGYGFHVTNPEAVVQGRKPILEEVGPFVYQALTIKDTQEQDGSRNIHYNEDGETLTYRPRRFYFLDRNQSKGDPDTTYITVPNIPLLTGFNKIRDEAGWKKEIAENILMKTGRGTPFVNVSFTGLLWGYYDDMPCVNLERPGECPKPKGEVDIFAEEEDDDWKRKKRETQEEDGRRVKRETVRRYKRETQEEKEDLLDKIERLKTANFDSMLLPKMEYMMSEDKDGNTNCDCEWGLFRDRNVTLRKAIKLHHGVGSLESKGRIVEYDDSASLNWWQPGSVCDTVGGQDSATLPPGVKKEEDLDIFIALMCRRITMRHEQDLEYQGLTAYRFVPPRNAMGSHLDTDPEAKNEANSCYCREEKYFPCFKSGVLNLAPCKTMPGMPMGAPIALSYPHFYQADPSYLEAVDGLSPDKEKHQMYADISPQFGFPLAFRPRFQLNAIIRKDSDIEVMSRFPEELVLPFLWAQDGFGEPSVEMVEAITFGLSAPDSLPMLGGSALLVLGGVMLLAALSWTMWSRRQGGRGAEAIPLS